MNQGLDENTAAPVRSGPGAFLQALQGAGIFFLVGPFVAFVLVFGVLMFPVILALKASELWFILALLFGSYVFGGMPAAVTGFCHALLASFVGWRWALLLSLPLGAFSSWLLLRHLFQVNLVVVGGLGVVATLVSAWILARRAKSRARSAQSPPTRL
ncbi:MAG: hypothetical protein CVV07_11845 [Gammaproteobacteria bacterium HGW-Gammaproteobacteria-11]|nr:MAG: hypothetical protein CVV07_11845 [Gammaproteobacteria bacterium HGW-Gammaproteobacteria-11]